MTNDVKKRKWIWHNGLTCPDIEGLRCDIQLRDGTVLLNENSYDWWSNWCWAGPPPKDTDIMAYRLIDD